MRAKSVKVTNEVPIEVAEIILMLKAIVAELEAKYGKIPELKDI
jgi:hypothetical protein